MLPFVFESTIFVARFSTKMFLKPGKVFFKCDLVGHAFHSAIFDLPIKRQNGEVWDH